MTCIKENDVFICDDLIDVWSFSIPQTHGDPVPYGNYMIDPPTIDEMEKIVKGDMIKISRDIDKIWTEAVDNVPCDRLITAIVVRSLHVAHPFNVGERIQFHYKNVYEIRKV